MNLNEFKIDPFGVEVGHTWIEVGVILDTINRTGIKRFVEIGVHRGGLTGLLVHSTEHIPGLQYLGVEINAQLIHPTIRKMFDTLRNAQMWIRDAHDPANVKEIANWAKGAAAPCMIYCDGGHKPTEFNLYAPEIRRGDYIAAHDWDYGGYRRAEIKPSDIEQVVAEQNLVPIGFVKPIRICLWRKV